MEKSKINFLSLARILHGTIYVPVHNNSPQVSASGKSQLRSCVERGTNQMQVYNISPRYPRRKPRGTTKQSQNNERPDDRKTALQDGFGAGSRLPPPGRPEWASHNWRCRQDVVVLVCIYSRGICMYDSCSVLSWGATICRLKSRAGEKHMSRHCSLRVLTYVRVFRVLFP